MRPFLILAALTVVVPLVWRLSGLSYDDGALGFSLFMASYVLLLPATLLEAGLRLLPPLRVTGLGLPSLAAVLLLYVWLDRRVTFRARRAA